MPSLETAARIDTNDQTCRAQAAHYRCQARMQEAQFEAKASEIRSAYIAELAEICGLE